METSSLSPLNHLRVAKGLPEMEVQVIRFKLPAIKTSFSSRPWIWGGPGGSEKLKKLFTKRYP